MSAYRSLLRCDLGAHHHSRERAKHQIKDQHGLRGFPPFVALEIVQADGDSAFYLMYIPESGMGADTFHLTLEDAKHQAEWEFGVKEDEWLKTDKPF
jgi:hypothetical protein